MRHLIVNADDFGRTSGTTRGIVRAHEQGVVTSASLMVRYTAASAASDYARRHPELSVGLHVDLGEWAYRDGQWYPVYEIPAEGNGDVGGEVERQLEAFRALVGADPTHLDSHQHVHRREPVATILIDLGQRLGVPVRHFSDVHYVGDFYGQRSRGQPLPEAITVERLMGLLASLPDGVSELACHPGYTDGLESTYLEEREIEVATLCDPRVHTALVAEGIKLRSFRPRVACRWSRG